MKKINEGIGAVGELIDKDMHESMSKILDGANEELRLSGIAVSKWQGDYDMAARMVNEKIKQQKDAYDELYGLVGQLELKIYRFEIAMKTWKIHDLMKAFKTHTKTFLFIFPYKVTVIDKEKVSENQAAGKAISRLTRNFLFIRDVLEDNMKYDAEAIKAGQFQPSLKFDIALKNSSTYMTMQQDFRDVEIAAESLSNRVSEIIDDKYIPQVHDLEEHMKKIAIAGQQFASLV